MPHTYTEYAHTIPTCMPRTHYSGNVLVRLRTLQEIGRVVAFWNSCVLTSRSWTVRQTSKELGFLVNQSLLMFRCVPLSRPAKTVSTPRLVMRLLPCPIVAKCFYTRSARRVDVPRATHCLRHCESCSLLTVFAHRPRAASSLPQVNG